MFRVQRLVIHPSVSLESVFKKIVSASYEQNWLCDKHPLRAFSKVSVSCPLVGIQLACCLKEPLTKSEALNLLAVYKREHFVLHVILYILYGTLFDPFLLPYVQ